MRFESEEEFEAFYKTLASPGDQLRELAEWRRFQIKIVSKFIDQIRLVADEQYSDIDHFLLELLQNADDNDYLEGTSPRVAIDLSNDELVLDNNEVGFNADNLYAITYAAASTKLRRKTASTYIGEKGIGFKSVFAVADSVEIHSGPYHFQLNNGEFIIPHPAASEAVNGTRIKLRFKSGRDDLARLLSQRLEQIGGGPQEFTLFLSKIRELAIRDRVAGRETVIRSDPDAQANFWRVECNGAPRRYVRHAYPRMIPGTVVETRFRDLKQEVPREIVLAIPLPAGAEVSGPAEGRLFCFLPTHVGTGCPIHIQADAKTTTNRENIQNFGSSPWNKCLFDGLAANLLDLYCKLTALKEFKQDLPAYWPVGVSQRDIGNADLKAILVQVEAGLGSQPLVLDRHGHWQCASEVRLLPEKFARWLADDACEKAVSSAAGAEVTFVDALWETRHRKALTTIGVRELTTDELLAALASDFANRTVPADELSQRHFLEEVISLGERLSFQASKLRQLPIFPVCIGDHRTWAPVSSNVFWVQSDSPKVTVGGSTPIIDATFTYTPGGGVTRTPEGDRVRIFNGRFRTFLSQVLGVPHHDEVQLLLRTAVKELKAATGELSDVAQRRKINQLWSRLFARAWKRQKTIINDLGQKAFDDFVVELRKCRIPAREVGTSAWRLVEVSTAFLGRPFLPDGVLDKIYAGTTAPFIQLDLLDEKKPKKKKRKAKSKAIDWAEWRRFFETIGVHSGPFYVSVDVASKDCLGSYQRIGIAHATFGALKAAADAAVAANGEFKGEGASSYSIQPTSKSAGLDMYSLLALRDDRGHALIGRRIGQTWDAVATFGTELRFTWGQKYSSRHAQTATIALFDQLRALLKLDSTQGLMPPATCFIASDVNRRVLGDIAPLVVGSEAGYPLPMIHVLGVRGDVCIDDLNDLIDQWADATPREVRNAAQFQPMIEVVCRYLEEHPDQAPQAEFKLRLLDPESGEMRGVADWMAAAAPQQFDAPIVARLRELLGRSEKRDAGSLAGILFEIGDVATQDEAFFRALAALGRQVVVEGSATALRVFEAKLAEIGISYGGRIIKSRQELPLVWDVYPVPATEGTWLSGDMPAEQHQFVSQALRILGWPCVSSARISVGNAERSRSLDQTVARQIAFTIEDVTKRLSLGRPDIGVRIRSVEFLKSAEAILVGVRIVNGLTIRVDTGSVGSKARVPFWRVDGAFYVDEACPVEKAVPEFIDYETNATCRGFFDLVWEQAKAQSRVTPGGGEAEPTDPPPHPGGSEGGAGGGAGTGGGETGGGGGTAGGGGGESGGSGGPSPGTGGDSPGDGGPRRRLCSLVMLGGGSVGGTKDGGGDGNKETKEVEEAGRRRMLAYFQGKGAQVVSREAENVGYDFDVTVGGKTIFVELKSSKDRWQGWEHALTRNEFIQAFAKGEDYFLCAVDRVLSEDWKIYFIGNPAGMVDQYIFDDPWKRVAVDMNDILAHMKSAEDGNETV